MCVNNTRCQSVTTNHKNNKKLINKNSMVLQKTQVTNSSRQRTNRFFVGSTCDWRRNEVWINIINQKNTLITMSDKGQVVVNSHIRATGLTTALCVDHFFGRMVRECADEDTLLRLLQRMRDEIQDFADVNSVFKTCLNRRFFRAADFLVKDMKCVSRRIVHGWRHVARWPANAGSIRYLLERGFIGPDYKCQSLNLFGIAFYCAGNVDVEFYRQLMRMGVDPCDNDSDADFDSDIAFDPHFYAMSYLYDGDYEAFRYAVVDCLFPLPSEFYEEDRDECERENDIPDSLDDADNDSEWRKVVRFEQKVR